MKPPKFHVGQAVASLVTCSGTYTPISAGVPRTFAMEKGSIYHVASVHTEATYYFYALRELATEHVTIMENCLVPVGEVSEEALAELLAEAFEPVIA